MKKILLVFLFFFIIILSGCNKETFTVTFDGNGGNYVEGKLTQTVKKGAKAKAPVFELEGYTLSWDKNISSIKSDLEVHAVWLKNGFGLIDSFIEYNTTLQENVYTIHTPSDYDLINITDYEKIDKGVSVTYYYDKDETQIVSFDDVSLKSGDNIFYAKISNKEKEVTQILNIHRRLKLIVNFVTLTNQTVHNQEVEEDGFAFEPDVELSREGYKFAGWDFDFTKPITTYTRIYAKWIGNSYEVSLDANGGEIEETKATVTCGEKADLPTPYKEGYDFLGWSYENNLVDVNSWNIAHDVTLVAMWDRSEMTFEIDYVIVGATGENLDYVYSNKKELVLKKPYKSGYEFLGWYYDSECQGERVEVIPKGTEGNLRLYSKWQPYVLKGKKVSFLGDSISTFYKEGNEVNSYYHGANQYYYPIYSPTVKDVNQTWWKIFLDTTETVLVTNESYSGSMVYGSGDTVGTSLKRINNLKNDDIGIPDLILIYLGTNDFIYSDSANLKISEQQFTDAYRLMLQRICDLYPMADVFVATLPYEKYSASQHTSHNSVEEIQAKRDKFNEIIRAVAKEKFCHIMDFSVCITYETRNEYLGDSVHPNVDGMKVIAKKAIEEVKSYLGV